VERGLFPAGRSKTVPQFLKDGDSLDDVEIKAIARFEELLEGSGSISKSSISAEARSSSLRAHSE